MINEIDLRALWKELDAYEQELKKETETLQEVWVKIAQLKLKNEAEATEMILTPEFSFRDAESAVVLNVGGQIFETTVGVLTRDPYSVLAALCRAEPVIAPDAQTGVYYLDRDWWLFRHILAFLRSHVLPNELETLKEMYVEGSYYRLESLQRAIEELPLDRVSNMSAQITTTWPGHMEGAANPQRRPMGRENERIFERNMFA